MKIFVDRHPVAFCLLLTLVLFGLWSVCMVVLPRTPVSNVAELPPELKSQLSERERALFAVSNPENMFRVLTVVLAVSLLGWLGWWREAGFNRPSRWRNLHLLLLPLVVSTLTVLGGVRLSGPALLASILFGALLAAFSDEAIFRGIAWRALVSSGVMRAVLATSVLSGTLLFGRLAWAGPWPEAFLLTMLTICAAFTYGALRWRTGSVWPVMLLHFVFAFASNVSMLPSLVAVSTFGLLGYGLLLLRNPRVRTDRA